MANVNYPPLKGNGFPPMANERILFMKIRITKCYLVEVTDDNGKEITSDFSFGTKDQAMELGKTMMKEIQNKLDKLDK